MFINTYELTNDCRSKRLLLLTEKSRMRMAIDVITIPSTSAHSASARGFGVVTLHHESASSYGKRNGSSCSPPWTAGSPPPPSSAVVAPPPPPPPPPPLPALESERLPKGGL